MIGTEKLTDREILSVLEPMGVELGNRSENLDIPNIQLIALQKIPDVAWLAVNLSGSVARVEVKERTLPPTPTDPNRPSNIRAAGTDGSSNSRFTEGRLRYRTATPSPRGCCWSAALSREPRALFCAAPRPRSLRKQIGSWRCGFP